MPCPWSVLRPVVVGLMVALVLVPGAASTVSAAPAPEEPDRGSGELVDLGDGRRMYLECAGEGGPTVVFESGYANDAEPWSLGGVFQGVAGSTRACVYDRPGTITGGTSPHVGRSDPVAMPRTAADVVADLHALLHAAEEPGPYVFVAHSLGGIFVRLYASTYPDEVAGMVLVDATSEHQNELLAPLTPPEFSDVLRQTELPPPPELPQLERILLDESFEQLLTAMTEQPMPPMPLVVLTHGVPLGEGDELPPGFPAEAWDRVIHRLQRRLAELVPGAQQVIATRSGHYIQLSEPGLVIDATTRVVDAVRRGDTSIEPSPEPC